MSQRNTGAFVGVVGPSGAGKDTLIRLTSERLAAQPQFVFPRRFVTRASTASEDHAVLSEEEFARRIRENRFALHWRAYDLGYAIDRGVLAAVAGGAIVSCNLSRDAIAMARERFACVKVVLVTADDAAIAARLAARGRESPAGIALRLQRNAECAIEFTPDLTILNMASPAKAAEELAQFLLGLRG